MTGNIKVNVNCQAVSNVDGVVILINTELCQNIGEDGLKELLHLISEEEINFKGDDVE